MDDFESLYSKILDVAETPEYFLRSNVELRISTDSLDQLGLSPYQAEIRMNRLLPYADQLDEEADKLLATVKAKLGKCVMYGDIYPGLHYWSSVFHTYIYLYGLRFTKEEHVAFVKLFYELTTIPGLQASSIQQFAEILILLLVKKELLSPKDLELPWRPLYNLCLKINKNMHAINVYKYSWSLRDIIRDVAAVTNIYFPLSATQEILDEIRPYFCSLTERFIGYFNFLQWFLPVDLPVNHHGIGHELWFDEFMKLWATRFMNTVLEKKMMRIMTKLASRNIGYIDWNPYIPFIFTTILHSLKMPVNYKEYGYERDPKIDPILMAEWVTSVLGGRSTAQFHLEKLLKTVETYFHPANVGEWSDVLCIFLNHLPYYASLRIYKERYKKETWETPIPESQKLTDTNIDAFVSSMMPLAKISIFNTSSGIFLYKMIRDLSAMRPNIVIPKILTNLYALLDKNATEYVFLCITSMLRPLVLGSRYFDKKHAYPEGPTHVMNFLYAALSAININEPDICLTAINFIKTCLSVIPVVDCSKTRLKRSEDDNIICKQTTRFKDFILQLVDKICLLITSGTHAVVKNDNTEPEEMDSFERMLLQFLYDIFCVLQLQTSNDLFTTAFKRFDSFVKFQNFETKVAIEMVATICKALSLKNAELVLRSFVPYFTKKIEIYFEDYDTSGEQLENHLVYLLIVLKKILSTQGKVILPYLNSLLPVIDKVVMLENQEISLLGCDLLKNLVHSLCNVQVVCCENDAINNHEYPHWEDWGKGVDAESARIKWSVPDEKELDATQKIFQRYFLPAVNKIQNYISNPNTLSQNELQGTLKIIYTCLYGCHTVLPFCKEEFILCEEHEDCDFEFSPTVGINYEITMPDGKNVKRFMVQVLSDLQDVMFKNIEHKTECFKLLVMIWSILSYNRKNPLQNYNNDHMKFWKAALKMRIIGDKGVSSFVLQEHVELRHGRRKTILIRRLTQTTKTAMMNLLKLTGHKYEEIRKRASKILADRMESFQCSYEIFAPYMIELLQSYTETNKDAYIGVLRLIIKTFDDLMEQNFQIITKLLTAIVFANPTEDSETMEYLDEIIISFKNIYSVPNITPNHMPDGCTATASQLWRIGLRPSELHPNEDNIQSRLTLAQNLGCKSLKAYYTFLEELIDAFVCRKLNWRYQLMVTQIITAIVQPDHLLPAKVVRYFLSTLIHDSFYERQCALCLTEIIFYQLRRKNLKIKVELPNQERNLKTGIRADNEWLLYDSSNWPTTAEKWDNSNYVLGTNIGFYVWPRSLEMYAPYAKQPNYDRTVRKMCEQEKEVDAFFSDPNNITQLIKFSSLDDEGDENEFKDWYMWLFHGLFKNHGDDHLVHFLPHLSRLVKDDCESSQRCASEIICGLIRGTKHWPYDKTKAMWTKLLPIIKLVLDHASMDTLRNWETCFSYAIRDYNPNRLFWLIEFIKDETIKNDCFKSVINTRTRLSIFIGICISNLWHMIPWLHRLLPQFESHLFNNPLENVRHDLAFIIYMVYDSEIYYEKKDTHEGIRKTSEFINPNQPLLQNLMDENSENGRKFLQTLCDFVRRWSNSYVIDNGSFYDLLPVFVKMENNDAQYPELAESCKVAIFLLASSRMPEKIPSTLKVIHKMSRSKLWCERASTVQFIELVLFYNMSLLLRNQDWIEEIRLVILNLLEDEVVEVREKAATVLSGMLHCTLITDRQALLDKFVKMAKKKEIGKTKESNNANSMETIRLRHAGILGMCAFILAHPYDIPGEVFHIFEHLNTHYNEPELILATIRRTFSDFKRTHCDIENDPLAGQLTPEQIELFRNINISYSYYS